MEQQTNIKIDQLSFSLRSKLLHNPPMSESCCIFRVPSTLRKHNEQLFKPNFISIGPYHRDLHKFQFSEKVKRWYLHCLITRLPSPDTTLQNFVRSIEDDVERCLNCYEDEVKMTRDAFAEMLIIDGCFIIELFRRFVCIVQKDDDPLFKMPWVRKVLVTDLLLLENQLPWFVLNRLFELSDTYDSEGRSLNQLAENFFHHSALRPGWIRVNSGLQNKHLLDLQRNIILLKSNESVDGGILPIPCVTELLLAGIDFAVGETDDLMKITFKNGVLTIPPVKVLDNAESLLRNLIAYEQCDKNLENRITAYAAFLDNLINSKEDLEYLHQKKIITYYLSSEDVSAFFDGLYNEVHVERSLYTEVSKDINAYCRSHWPRWRIRLTRDYFNNPWSIISLIGAIMILVLTFLQTLYAILYH